MFNCSYIKCNYADKSVSMVLKHIFSKHSMESNFSIKCLSPFCSKQFKNFNDLKTHLTHNHKDINVTLNFNEKTINNCKYKCPSEICSELIVDTKGLRSHIYKHLRTEKGVFLNCFYKNCPQNYSSDSVRGFEIHFSHYHKNDNEVRDIFLNNNLGEEFTYQENCNLSITGNFDLENNINTYNQAYQNQKSDENLGVKNDSNTTNENNDDMIKLYHMMYNKYFSKYLIPKNTCNEIFNDFNEMINLNNQILIGTILSYNKKEISIDALKSLINNNSFNLIHKLNKSDMKKKEWCRNSDFYIEPKEILLSLEEKVYYIPLLENLKSILKNDIIKNEFFKTVINSNNSVSSFNDSKRFKERNIFNCHHKTIQLKLFIDECETSNPIGDNRKIYKMTGVYFKIGNLDNRFQSANHLTFIVMIFKSKFLNKYSYETILNCLQEDLKKLETEGILVEYNGTLIKLLGSISFICADSLGANSFGGLVESFNPKLKPSFHSFTKSLEFSHNNFFVDYCRFCYGTYDEIQNKFTDSDFVKRSKETHEEDLQELSLIKDKGNFNGVKSRGCLLDLENFYTIGNLAPDVMHDLLEGCLPFDFSCMLNKLKLLKIINPEKIRESIKMFDYGRINAKNKVPYYLIDDKKINSATQLTMSATHMWTLVLIFPIIFGFELKDNIYYKNFIELAEIFQHLNDTNFDEIKICNIELKINSYLTKFRELYPEKNIKPKQHFLVHYPESIRNFGPPITYSTMRFESKHSFFKLVNKSVHNKNNIFKSLAERHQLLQNYFLSSNNLFKELDFQLLVNPNTNRIQKFIEIYNLENPEILKWLDYGGIEYRDGDLLRIKYENDLPKFAQIQTIVLHRNSFFFELKFFKTVEYLSFLLAYELVDENRIELINYNDILCKFPMDLLLKKGRLFVSPKFAE
ncbi:unnamed protein product [Brachionus calyciflorus]|uniref:C2H2-type domain-containing protein n=1 Tax=Brachionus calyciflorus TaxID=104777 RepID=A0A813UEN9_9BILA|nr:unnamed protein product [Brachionus calyciflorus]